MPIRLLREGILSSDRVDQLDAPAEVFYRRLMSKVDDHGLYDARPSILRASLFPLRVDRVREADISRWIAACEKAGLIALYQHDGKPFMQMLDTRWVARSEPKYPLRTAENTCSQLKTPVPVFGVVVGVEDVVPPWRSGEGFESFWEPYPRKVAKGAALKAWDRLKPPPELQATIVAAVKAQVHWSTWTKDGGQYIPHPASWLGASQWTDEPPSIDRRGPDRRNEPASAAPDADATAAMLAEQRARVTTPAPAHIREQLRAVKGIA